MCIMCVCVCYQIALEHPVFKWLTPHNFFDACFILSFHYYRVTHSKTCLRPMRLATLLINFFCVCQLFLIAFSPFIFLKTEKNLGFFVY